MGERQPTPKDPVAPAAGLEPASSGRASPAGGIAAVAEPAGAAAADGGADGAHLPHVVAWNLTRRCNLACAHCYIAAGSWHAAAGELSTAECRRIIDEIFDTHRAAVPAGRADSPAQSPAPLFILSGGEPLLRDDLEEIAAYGVERGATVVVGTNGTRLTAERIESLKDAGVTGVAISVDSLDPVYHDRFRHSAGALEDTLGAVDRLREQRLDFIVQTSLTRGNRAELPELIEWAASKGAVAFNLYFLVSTGRGSGMRGLEPEENEAVLRQLVALEHRYRGRMMIRSKCQPQIMRHVHESDADSPLANYATRCPCGVHYCRITPEGKVTPCPYMPVVAGDLREDRFDDVWFGSRVFSELRTAASGDEVRLGGKCGRCEYRLVCGGCRARAYADTSDYLAADESCAYEPDGTRPPVRPAGPTYYQAEADAELAWTPEARRRMRRVPGFVRGVVTARVESFARERGYGRITPAVLDEVRRSLPVDFSKRKPFFLRDADE